ncbi:hypothetical protein O181_028830 [Austropuccinia psidii MF-1]|uniref:Uncharacterized protein n=1 Tax=Austropuccinia psidii MF-1 TaxID=1389203 RepID=A0A9Q3H4L8_9BASI|nr:hypothetical protein [Austropuccinia psidii MF-1]
MTVFNKAGNIKNNAEGLRRWESANTPDKKAYVPLEAEPQIPISAIKITDIGTEFLEEVKESYKQDKNFHILTSLLNKDCKGKALVSSLNEIRKTSYSERIFHFCDGIIYHRTENSCVMTLCITLLINTIIYEFHNSIYYGNLSEDITLE